MDKKKKKLMFNTFLHFNNLSRTFIQFYYKFRVILKIFKCIVI